MNEDDFNNYLELEERLQEQARLEEITGVARLAWYERGPTGWEWIGGADEGVCELESALPCLLTPVPSHFENLADALLAGARGVGEWVQDQDEESQEGG